MLTIKWDKVTPFTRTLFLEYNINIPVILLIFWKYMYDICTHMDVEVYLYTCININFPVLILVFRKYMYDICTHMDVEVYMCGHVHM